MPTLRLQLEVGYADLPNDQLSDIENHFVEMVQQLTGDEDILRIDAKIDDRQVLDFKRATPLPPLQGQPLI